MSPYEYVCIKFIGLYYKYLYTYNVLICHIFHTNKEAFAQEVLNSAYSKLVAHPGGQILPTQIFCDLLNISFCQITEDNDKVSFASANRSNSLVDGLSCNWSIFKLKVVLVLVKPLVTKI